MLDQVEFYLPQLAHMVVHLERELPMEDMEQFVLLLSQSSVHFALQFFWMIYAALDENRPKRAGNNPQTFARCARLLLALEQCFVYGSPAARQASELLTRQSISRDEMEQILLADRRFSQLQQSSSDSTSIERRWYSNYGSTQLDDAMVSYREAHLAGIYKPADSQPRAAIPLHGAKVHVVENKRPFYFEIAHDFSETKAKFAAKTADDFHVGRVYPKDRCVTRPQLAVQPKEVAVLNEHWHERAPCLIYFATEESESGEDVSTVLFNELYETRTSDVCDIDEDDEIVTAFDQHAADIALRQARTSHASRAKHISSQMSSFLRELLSLDDLRQEVLVMQLISYFQQIFELEKLPLRLHPYRILSTGSTTGLIEVVRNAMSLDGIRRPQASRTYAATFEQMYGGATNSTEGGDNAGEGAELLRQAKLNFIHSLAAYSIVCYILAIKDRHNGNIMLDIEGFIIHIDFGFFLGRAPGGSFSFETAPFKLTAEMVDVLGGRHSSNFQYFTDLCVQGALAARKHAETIYTLVEVMSYHSKLPCFVGGAAGPLSGLKDRLFLNIPDKKVAPTIQSMVQRAYDHFGTNKYDQFQTFSNGIAK
ncbi:hypothetical protein PInf_014544 [Phytophthora infestans]|nr:hypothetical protein PInf_014544 [Phytophthora infestans]